MRVYALHLTGPSSLTRAFDRVFDCAQVASCTVDSALVRLRFVAAEKVAERLLHGIYLEGGLTWCSSHELREGDRAGGRQRQKNHALLPR